MTLKRIVSLIAVVASIFFVRPIDDLGVGFTCRQLIEAYGTSTP
jgi:hypothetical protein